MNLKFWKKMPPQDEADDLPPGLLARLRTRISLLTERFKPTPPFQAEVSEGEDASAGESPDTDAESPEIATKSGMIARMQTAFSASLLWIKTAASPESGSRTKLIVGAGILLLTLLGIIGFATWQFLSPARHDDEQHSSTLPIDRPASEPFATLTESGAPQEKSEDQPPADSIGSAPVSTETLADQPPSDESAIDTHPVLLPHSPDPAASAPVAIAPAAEAASTPHATSMHDAHPASAVTPQPAIEHSTPTPLTPEAEEIAQLKKDKAELQKKLNALRVEKQKADAASRLQRGKSPALGGSVTVPSNDPKGTVDTLKAAIDAMNSGTGDHQKKPAK